MPDAIGKLAPILTDPEIMGGTPCFAGTRVPVKNLFDYLACGYPLDEFLRQSRRACFSTPSSLPNRISARSHSTHPGRIAAC